MNSRIFPKSFRRIGIAAPAGPADREAFAEGMLCLRNQDVEPVPAPHLFSGTALPYLAASDEERAADLNTLIRDESIDAVQCVRGGYGTPRILDKIDWNTLKRRNLPIIGFSDITAIHLAMYAKKAGIPAASQMTARLGSALADPETVAGMRRIYQTPSEPSAHCVPLPILKGTDRTVQGPLIPVNLSLLAALCGSGFLPDFRGAILVLEDIGEKVRILDRHLTQLRHAGILNQCAAVVFAQFTDCGEPEERRVLFHDFLPHLPDTVLNGLPYGHELPSMSFVFGERAEILPDGTMRLVQGGFFP